MFFKNMKLNQKSVLERQISGKFPSPQKIKSILLSNSWTKGTNVNYKSQLYFYTKQRKNKNLKFESNKQHKRNEKQECIKQHMFILYMMRTTKKC